LEDDMSRIIYQNEEGRAAIVIPSPNYKGTMEALASKVVPRGRTYQIVDDGQIPEDRTYRNAWVEGDKKIDIDMPRARVIFLDNIRTIRNAKLAELDVEVMKKIEKGESTAELATEKQRLRDLPETLAVEVEHCETVKDFEKVEYKI